VTPLLDLENRANVDGAEAALLKTLLVHAASWDGGYQALEVLLAGTQTALRFKESCARLLGYGAVRQDRLAGSSASRVVLAGVASLAEDLAHVYSVPLPPSLSGDSAWRRLTITLSWITNVNPMHRAYRTTQLWFDAPKETLSIERAQAQWQMVRRGTVQHEVLEGERAAVFADGDTLDVRVNCRSDAGESTAEVPYALAVTLETASLVGISIYDEVAERIRPRVVVAAQGA
jgi:hypothetical protein